MIAIDCPECGEVEDLAGTRDGSLIRLQCLSCGHRWERDTTLRCRLCGSIDLRRTPKPLWEKGRGDQRTPAGFFDAYACNACGGADVTASG